MSLDLSTAPSRGPRTHHRAAPPRATSRWRRQLTRFDIKASPYLYVLPFFLLFAVFGLYPMVYTAWIALTDRSPLNMTINFIGADNFVELWHDHQFWTAVQNTLGIFVLSTVPQLLLALLLANALNRKMRGLGFFRMAIAIPIITSTAVVGLVFGFVFARDFGLVNWLLEQVGINKIDWRANRLPAWGAISAMVDWRWTGYNALIYLAAMQSIPRDMYEAAAIDGASRRRQFWTITIPLLRPTIIFTVIISTIGGLQLFAEPLMFDNSPRALSGGTQQQFQTVTMYLVQTMNERLRYGYAGAIALALFVLIVIISLINYALIRRISSDK
ncbi:MAG: sugar ABC transporter permease [Micromonosporaceae bacterium]|nr:sugar ABC transporter permease [Micromonosporaceae bacterium]